MARGPINAGPINALAINAGGEVPEVPAETLDGVGRQRTDPVWLLDLVVGGRVLRFASVGPVEVETVEGDVFLYEEGLTDPGIGFGDVSGFGEASVGLTVDSDVPWAGLAASGHPLDGCEAVLRLWTPGTVLERSKVVLSGESATPEYGAVGEPFAFSLERMTRGSGVTLPPPQAVVSPPAFPRSGKATWEWAVGMQMPIVIGSPGADDGVVRGVVPVPPVDYTLTLPAVVITAHLAWIGGPASEVTVRMVGSEEETTSTETVTTLTDGLGRTYRSVDLLPQGERPALYVGFAPGTGGLEHEGRLLRGAGDVLHWILTRHYRGKVDLGRLGAVRSALNVYKVDTYLNAPVDPFEWLVAEILPWLPVELREGQRGIWPALIRWDVQRSDVVAVLQAGVNVDRVSSVSLVGEVLNEIVVDYRPCGDRFLGRRIHTAVSDLHEPVGRVVRTYDLLPTDERIVGNALAALSQRRYGLRRETIELPHTWDTATADRVARDLLLARAFPRKAVSYAGETSLLDLEIGQVVALTDADLSFSDVLAVVADVTPAVGGGAVVDVLLV